MLSIYQSTVYNWLGKEAEGEGGCRFNLSLALMTIMTCSQSPIQYMLCTSLMAEIPIQGPDGQKRRSDCDEPNFRVTNPVSECWLRPQEPYMAQGRW